MKQKTGTRTIQHANSARISIITAITSYLGFFVLLVLVVETVLGAIALKNEGQSQLVALYGFLAVVILMIVVVSFFAYFSPATLTSASLQQLHDFGGRISGSWWEFVTPDVPSAVSLAEISVDAATGLVSIKATAYGRDGQVAAFWETVATCVNLGQGKVFYYWKGLHPTRPSEPFEGFGEISFDQSPAQISRASGMFSDSNLANLSQTTRKSSIFQRCTPGELKVVRGGDGKVAAALIRQKSVEPV